jgi:VIT1/CCC1 family predicted Fe2+/Mn2+ transporter
MQKLKLLALSVLAAMSFALVPATAAFALDARDPLCEGANLEAGTSCSSGITDEAAKTKVNNVIKQGINILSFVVGAISVVMVIIGGLKYVTSGGDSGNVTGAKNTILYAVIGLVVVALAQFIVRFVLSRISGTTA